MELHKFQFTRRLLLSGVGAFMLSTGAFVENCRG